MKEISAQELFEFYEETINKCGIYLLDKNDRIIESNIFEDFDIGVHSFLHPDNLNLLYNKGLISCEKLKLSSILREKVIELQNSFHWDFKYFKTSNKWQEIMKLCDTIKTID